MRCSTEAAEADAIANLVNQLALLHGDPERFHLIKDEAAVRLRRMAKRMRGEPETARPVHAFNPRGRMPAEPSRALRVIPSRPEHFKAAR